MNSAYFHDYCEFVDKMPVNNSVGALNSLYHHMIVCTICYHVSFCFYLVSHCNHKKVHSLL